MQNIEQFEDNSIKEYRDEYIKDSKFSTKKYIPFEISITLLLIPVLISLIILIINNFTIKGYIYTIVSILITNIIIHIVLKTLGYETNHYLKILNRNGYLNIDTYESMLNKILFGPEGKYNAELVELEKKYNINEKTKVIEADNGEKYFIWNTIILNTEDTDMYFKATAKVAFDELIKNKWFENIKFFDPQDYINDYEINVKRIKTDIEHKQRKSQIITSNYLSKIIISLILLVTSILLITFINKFTFLLKIINILLILYINYAAYNITTEINNYPKTTDDYMVYLSNNSEAKEQFNELKVVLRVNDLYDKIYNKEGICYITWVANGYFHIFLNVVYFEVVYMAVKTSDVDYFKVEGNECIIKLKNQKLAFEKEAAKVFAKLLSSKDYNWLKTIENNTKKQ